MPPLMLAGVHMLHAVLSIARLFPVDGRMRASALAQPLRRFALVQLVVQPVAVGALFTFSGGAGTVPGLSIIGAVMLTIAATVLA